MDKERRQFKRWKVSIPCTITHKGEATKGKITNISLSGALITELTTAPPPEKAFVTVTFQVDQVSLTQRNVAIKASVDSSVVRKYFDTQDDEIVGSIGAKFQDHSLEGQSRLEAAMRLIVRLQQERDMLASKLRES